MPESVSDRGAEQASMTCLNAVSNRIDKVLLRSDFFRLLDIFTSSVNRTSRGSGLHHKIGSPSLNQGNIPCLYAFQIRVDERSPPTANRPSSRESVTGGN